MKTNTTPEPLTLTPEQFTAMFLPILQTQDTDITPADYFVHNLDTGKLELHITKPTYKAYDDETKQAIWREFKWSRDRECWIERTIPGYKDPESLWIFAKHIGLADGGYFITMYADSAKAETKADPDPAKDAAPIKPTTPVKATETEKRAKTIPTAKVNIDSEEVCYALHGSDNYVSDRKIRIAALYAHNPTSSDAKAFLKEEHGISGHSHTLKCGASGFVDYDGKGMRIWICHSHEELQLSWVSVHSYIRDMINRGEYLNEKEQARYDEIKKQYHGKAPMPNARYAYPPVRKGA